MRAFVLGSGSSGNAILVEAGGARVLVDAGIGPCRAAARLATFGVDLLPRGVDAIVATHQHGDHFSQVEKLARAFGAPVYLHAGIEASRLRRKFPVRDYEPGRAFHVGPIEVLAEKVPHDAPQVALRLATDDAALGVATDVGRVTAGLVGLLGSCDAALVEANHCPELLAFGPYPPSVRARVSGGLGHLSNLETASLARRLVGTRLVRLWLGHLSRANNTPERALAAVSGAAPGLRVEVVGHDECALLEVVRSRPAQLALPFGRIRG